MASNFNELLDLLQLYSINGSVSSDEGYTNNYKNGLGTRDRYYSQLLSNYVDISKKRNSRKEFHKWFFFWVIIAHILAIDTAVVLVFIKFLNTNSTDLWNVIPAVISAVTAFISTIITIPVTVTKYLFNVKEDDNMREIISHTQEYDEIGHKILLKNIMNNRGITNSNHLNP